MQRISIPFILFFLFLCICNVQAQSTDIIFLGTVSVAGGETYPYKLFVNDSDHILTGYSVTDIGGPNETKTSIHGSLNASKKLVTFNETKLIYTKSKLKDVDFCFIHARLKTSKMQGATMLKGSFTGYKADGVTECGKGKIMLLCAQDILDKLLAIAAKTDTTQDAPDTVKKEQEVVVVHEQAIDEAKVLKVLPGKTINIACSKPTVSLDIWDAKDIDNDIITLMRDGKTLLENYTISGTYKTVNINMGDSKTANLRLIAVSEGSEPVNTARIKITSGTDVYYVDASTTIGNDVWIHLTSK